MKLIKVLIITLCLIVIPTVMTVVIHNVSELYPYEMAVIGVIVAFATACVIVNEME